MLGHDDTGAERQELPPLEFSYSTFRPQDPHGRDFYPVKGSELPVVSLGDQSFELVDLFGNGLADVLEMNETVRYWRNLGGGVFDIPRLMDEAPAGVRLSDAGVQLLDANGDGRADLLVASENFSGYYRLDFAGRWDNVRSNPTTTLPVFRSRTRKYGCLTWMGTGSPTCCARARGWNASLMTANTGGLRTTPAGWSASRWMSSRM
jgi:hypothetical protein